MPVDLEPFCLAAAAVEREHQLGAEALAVRVLGDQRLELGDEREVAAERQLGVDPLLDGREPELLEPLRLDLREPLELEIPERPSVPEGFRGAQGLRRGSGIAGRERLPPVRGEPLEALEVELSRLDPQQVAARAGGETRLVTGCRAEDLAEPRDVVPQRVVGGVDALIREQLADQPLARRRRGSRSSRSSARSARCFGPPAGTATPSTRTVSGPRIRNSRRLAAIAPIVSTAGAPLPSR